MEGRKEEGEEEREEERREGRLWGRGGGGEAKLTPSHGSQTSTHSDYKSAASQAFAASSLTAIPPPSAALSGSFSVHLSFIWPCRIHGSDPTKHPSLAPCPTLPGPPSTLHRVLKAFHVLDTQLQYVRLLNLRFESADPWKGLLGPQPGFKQMRPGIISPYTFTVSPSHLVRVVFLWQ